MQKYILISFFLFAFLSTIAQETIEITDTPKKKDSVRDSYIKRFPEHFFIYPVIKQRTLSFELQTSNRNELLTFKPNNSFNLGIGAYLFEIGAELSFAIPLNQQRKDIYGESTSRDVQLNLLSKKWGLDLFYQKYSGFYIADKNNEPDAGTPYPQRPDINSRNFGITGHYLFNHNKFSFRSVYNFSERQLYSKGSFLVYTSISSFRFTADRSILTSEQELLFGEDVSFKYLRYTTFGIAPGYTYSLIYKNFFLNGALALGPAHHWIHYERENTNGKDDIAINTFVAARIGIGYNGQRLFGGIGFYSQGNNVNFEGVEFSNKNGSFKIVMGYRFKEFGILKKRAWDVIPFKL
jgi:hypothetical protein